MRLEEEEHVEGTQYLDEWGVEYIKNGWPIMAQTKTPIKDRADWEKYKIPSPTAPHRFKMLRDGNQRRTAATWRSKLACWDRSP